MCKTVAGTSIKFALFIYQFTFEMAFSVRVRSPFNIAPCTRTDVRIQESLVKLPFVSDE